MTSAPCLPVAPLPDHELIARVTPVRQRHHLIQVPVAQEPVLQTSRASVPVPLAHVQHGIACILCNGGLCHIGVGRRVAQEQRMAMHVGLQWALPDASPWLASSMVLVVTCIRVSVTAENPSPGLHTYALAPQCQQA